ncbi:MAG: MucR family transcriptional regulator [bacterium]
MEEHIKQAIEIVKAQATIKEMTNEEMSEMVDKLSKQFKALEEGESVKTETQEPAVDPKKSIREKTIVCLECGKQFKVITRKHLAKHDLTPEEYKEKWGLKKDVSLVSKGLARERRKKMSEMKLWERKKNAKPKKEKKEKS